MSGAEWLDLSIGALQLLLGLLVLKHLRRFGRSFPWLIALMLFFLVRGSQRLYSAFTDTTQQAFGLVGDALLLAVLVLLLVGLQNTVRGLELALDEADARAAEYARALRDYRTLARHRVANPLAVIRGGLATLRELELDPADRESVFHATEQAAFQLEHVMLEPESQRAEERALRPKPAVDHDSSEEAAL